MAEKLPVQIDNDMAALAGIKLEACAAYYNGDDEIRILGEAVTANGKSIEDYREMQAVAYDADGDIIGRSYTNWGSFQIRQSFEIYIDELPCDPVRVRVFPSKSD
ncbi:hypothetical protein Poly51_06780 [Rubripirellula tenax]|uniref:Uncharacterized protein n=1 Tax=Rubripirellula tenax TaxID=2528015 RepID=A0A5C6FLG9_9BACT|nr:hypothetical protein [Rubripirellula tenax]TWU60402.1 hypothetical protein Poly51_06780 [Rubripirellula tenax]